ncbi:MAG: cation diffusion facilitator family transporter [Gammaproteobacteria bacterium]|nr:cation diffusion facilitator family transporter [Gammaproteobacteria bacterium]
MHSHTDHGHQHDHAHGPDDFSSVNMSFLIAVGANLAFTVIEAIYGFLTNSVSLLGDAGHNLSDVLGLLLAWGAAVLAGKVTSSAYSYGLRKSTILAAVSNAIILVFAAGFIAWESIGKFITPSPIAATTVMVVATIGIAVNAGTALLFMKGSQYDLSLRGAFLHLADDAAISAGSLYAALVIMMTGWLWVDPVMGLAIVAVILMGTWGCSATP